MTLGEGQSDHRADGQAADERLRAVRSDPQQLRLCAAHPVPPAGLHERGFVHTVTGQERGFHFETRTSEPARDRLHFCRHASQAVNEEHAGGSGHLTITRRANR